MVSTVGIVYEALLIFTSFLAPYRFPIPYAVPIFDIPFVLVATGVGYLCLERHRLRQDFQSAAIGLALWFAALLAIAHILTQPDYPGTPGVNPGVAPYLFFASYLAALTGMTLGTHYAGRGLSLTDRLRWLTTGATVALSVVIVLTVVVVQPVLPSLVMKPGRLTPFAVWTAGILNGAVALWGMWGWWRRRGSATSQHFGNFLALASFIWLVGLIGFLLFPYRYAISWYLAGVARPLGVGVIFVALLREQVWLYREARARLRDLEQLHQAGQALVTSRDATEIVDTIASKGLTIAQADASVLFRFDAEAQVLRAVTSRGSAGVSFDGLELPIGHGPPGVAGLERRPVWISNIEAYEVPELPADVGARIAREGFRAMLSVPLLAHGGEVLGSLSVLYRGPRTFTDPDVQLLSAFGTQASAALENARAFDRLAAKASHDAELQEFGRRLLEATAEAEIVDDAVTSSRRLLRADCIALLLTDAAGRLRLAGSLGWRGDIPGIETVEEATASFARYAVLGKGPIEVDDLALQQRFPVPGGLVKHDVHSAMMVRLDIREQLLGVLAVYGRAPRHFNDEEKRVLGSLAHQTAIALDKTRLYAELQNNLRRLHETQAQLIQADKLKALGTLLSGMAHELNNPLSTIRLSVQLIKRTSVVGAAVTRRLDVIDGACTRASRIISDLLVFARRRSPERRLVAVNQIIQAALRLQRPQLELNKIRLVTRLEPMPSIWADSHQIQQVFLNLFSNAIHAMSTTESERVLTVSSVHGGSEVVVKVQDHGPGIPPEHLGRIFDPFFTTKATGAGTGLGLSLSIGIVEAHGGRMHVENVAGAGACFTVRLPIGHGVEAAPGAAPERAIPTVAASADVLVVEDEDPLRGVVTEVMRGLGHQVIEATTGQEALSLLETRTYDLVMLDLRLPDVDGQAVWQRAIAPHPRLAGRVVFMTGDIMSSETQEFLDQTGRPCLMKPFTIEQVGRVVNEVLAGAP
jgi:signal transduction histidine kinase/CheY-like chemotaxis protein